MQITESWQEVFPQEIQDRYDFCETRNAAAILKATSPDAFNDVSSLLSGFELTLEKLVVPGGSKSVVARELDETMRVSGWREARFDQRLVTTLTIFPWAGSTTKEMKSEVKSENEYGGHKVDNVLGRAALDVEWNPKDGNLDRDLSNYVSLHEGGIIDCGLILTRTGGDLRILVRDLIAEVRQVSVPPEYKCWHERIKKLSIDPLGTSTTSNMGKLIPRIERGDGRGCPILGVGITERCYAPPTNGVRDEVLRIAHELEANA